MLFPLLTVLILLLPVSAPSSEEPAETLAQRLAHGDASARKAALRALARRGEAADWKLVLGALDDPRGEVAEVAQWELGRRANEEALALLLGRAGLRSRSVSVRRRAAELLGRVPLAVDAKSLLEHFGESDRETRRLLFWSMERLARAGRLTQAEQLAGRLARAARSGRDELLRGRALSALSQVGGETAVREVRRAIHARQSGLRRAAVLCLPGVLDAATIEPLVEAVSRDETASVRLAAVDVLAGLRSRMAALGLVRCLAGESEERVRRRIVAHLRALSGLRYRTDPEPWRAWSEKLPDDWQPSSERSEGEGGERSVSFADYRPCSKRITFLVDLSGSIHVRKGGGKTRKERVDEELAKLLLRLPPDARFNLIPFAGEPLPWKPELTRATPRSLRAAADFFSATTARGSGDLWEALLLAMEDPDVDTVVVITDGAPTGGLYNRLELLVALLLERNLTRGLSIDSILVDAPRGVARHWQALAEGSAGQSIRVSLP